MDSSDEKIVVENVNVPGSKTRVSKAMYDAMKQAMWQVLPAAAPGLTQSEYPQQSLLTYPKTSTQAARRLAGGRRRCSWISRPRARWSASQANRCAGIALLDHTPHQP